MKITISAVKDWGKFLGITDTADNKFSCWKMIGTDNPHENPAIPFMKEGETVDIITKPSKDLKYNNITGVMGQSPTKAPEKATTGQETAKTGHSSEVPQEVWNQKDKEKRNGIALRYALDLFIAGKIERADIYLLADEFGKYIATGE